MNDQPDQDGPVERVHPQGYEPPLTQAGIQRHLTKVAEHLEYLNTHGEFPADRLSTILAKFGGPRPEEASANRWWSAAMGPFFRELAHDRAESFHGDLLSVMPGGTAGVDPDASCRDVERRLTEIARHYGLPYATAWGITLEGLVVHSDDDRFIYFLPSEEAHWLAAERQPLVELYFSSEYFASFYIKIEDEPESLMVEKSRRTWYCSAELPSPTFPPDQRLRFLEHEVQRAFDPAWKECKRLKQRLHARLVIPDQSQRILTRVTKEEENELMSLIPTSGVYRDIPLGYVNTSDQDCRLLATRQWPSSRVLPLAPLQLEKRVDVARRMFAERLLKMVDAARTMPSSWKTTGRPPDWSDAARWWALQTFDRLTVAEIVQREDPDCVDETLPERIHLTLRRLRQRVD